MLSGLHPTQEVHPNWLLLCCCPSSARIKTKLIIFSLFWWRNRMKVQLPRGFQSCPLILSVLQAIRSSCHTHWSGTAGWLGRGEVLLCLKLWGLLSALAARATETCRLHNRSDGIKRRENSGVEPLPVLCVCVFSYSRQMGRTASDKVQMFRPEKRPRRTKTHKHPIRVVWRTIPALCSSLWYSWSELQPNTCQGAHALLSEPVTAHNLCLDRRLNKTRSSDGVFFHVADNRERSSCRPNFDRNAWCQFKSHGPNCCRWLLQGN